MKDKLTIPDNIQVGFQNRRDTYTGKLAFIVYKDVEGNLKQKKSWTQWCSDSIPKVEFKNEPTSGFVLNKKVGGGGWSRRDTWARVYDPRGFEFEISIPNLFFILQECSAIKGKGLEGEFVLAWDRQKVILLPVSSQEYKSSLEHSILQSKTLTEDDMAEGCIYKTKGGKEVLYLGKQTFYYMHTTYIGWSQPAQTKQRYTRKHIFVSAEDRLRDSFAFKGRSSPYWVQPGFNKLAERLTMEPAEDFADEFEKFKNSVHGKKPEKIKTT